jgi:hypothetical protein
LPGLGGFCVSGPVSKHREAADHASLRGSHARSLGKFGSEHPEVAITAVTVPLGTFVTAWLLPQNPNFLCGYDLVRMHAFYKVYFRKAALTHRPGGLGIEVAVSLLSAVLVPLVAAGPSRGPGPNGIALAPE